MYLLKTSALAGCGTRSIYSEVQQIEIQYFPSKRLLLLYSRETTIRIHIYAET